MLTRQFLCFLAGFFIGIFAIISSVSDRKTPIVGMIEVDKGMRVTSNLTKTAAVLTTSDPVQPKACPTEKIIINEDNLAEFYDEFYKYYALKNQW